MVLSTRKYEIIFSPEPTAEPHQTIPSGQQLWKRQDVSRKKGIHISHECLKSELGIHQAIMDRLSPKKTDFNFKTSFKNHEGR
jgi:hypothetical protein